MAGPSASDRARAYQSTRLAEMVPADTLVPSSWQDAGRQLGDNLGVAGRGLVMGVSSPITMVADPVVAFLNRILPQDWQQSPPSTGLTTILDRLGVPRARTVAQQVLESAAAGMGAGGSVSGLSRSLSPMAQGVVKRYLDALGENSGGQMLSGFTGGAIGTGASKGAQSAGASPEVAQLAGLGGTLLGGVAPVRGLKFIGDSNGPQYQLPEADSGKLSGSGELRGGPGLLAQPGGAPAAREADGSLQGLPRKGITAYGQEVIPSAHLPAHDVARDYMSRAGLEFNPPATYQKVLPDRAKAIAQAFDEMAHDPQHPEVAKAYSAMANETLAQYHAIKDAGVKFEFLDPSKPDPYHGNPREMTEDVRNNKHMWVFPTDAGFGSNAAFDVADNPLLANSGESWNGKPATINDIFRGVHDYFGHVKEGVGFRADGEENAWRSHSSMYSPLARKAMTTETRGQNSWVNYGPHGGVNRTAKSEDTHFADQKIGILPDWVISEGAHDPTPTGTTLAQMRQASDVVRSLAKSSFPVAGIVGGLASLRKDQ